MGRFIVRRGLYSVAVVMTISALVFVLLHITVDPALVLLPPEVSREELELFREQMGLNRPLVVQFLDYMGSVLRFEFGKSYVTRTPVVDLLVERLPATLQLSAGGLLVALCLGIPLGMAAAARRGGIVDNLASAMAVIGQAIPIFWLGLMLIHLFAVQLRWLPASGIGTPAHLVLPSISLGVYLVPMTMRLLRSSLLDVLGQDYIRVARAKGLSEFKVFFKHAFRNAVIPAAIIIGMQAGLLVSGAVVTETVFAWPGLGQLAVQSIRGGDYPVVQAMVILFSLIIVIANLLSDILISLLDPRVRFE